MPDAFDRQVGGDHYKGFEIEPAEFNIRNKIPFAHGNVVKYVVRHTVTGNEQDLLKAIHYIDLIIECENRNAQESTPEEETETIQKGTIFTACPACSKGKIGRGPDARCDWCGWHIRNVDPGKGRDNAEPTDGVAPMQGTVQDQSFQGTGRGSGVRSQD